ncbi:hypothetical protein [Algoriphagus zhangzhouensis]|uniref:Uncharacterized protein n=1 Tax=Algoriphagus zhangzhouensis TaxID=1073327 RepID=A0A1M7ZGZ2_9BACT|nr:hypothetical protein [Algoriphagus zhangzhouensis]TDY44077.1 hypothetical protein A8938_3284 [Algoriphagus zhangzhouensis]SHO64185.1 hypothetical protein SAMN04488108_3280 [Algoriphagus zhangzhouensis]
MSNTGIIIVVSIVALHFVIGIGYLVFKLSGKSEDEKDSKNP